MIVPAADEIVVLDPAIDAEAPDDLPSDVLLLAVDGDAAALGDAIGRYAAAVDAGESAEAAFAATLGAGEPVATDA